MFKYAVQSVWKGVCLYSFCWNRHATASAERSGSCPLLRSLRRSPLLVPKNPVVLGEGEGGGAGAALALELVEGVCFPAFSSVSSAASYLKKSSFTDPSRAWMKCQKSFKAACSKYKDASRKSPHNKQHPVVGFLLKRMKVLALFQTRFWRFLTRAEGM